MDGSSVRPAPPGRLGIGDSRRWIRWAAGCWTVLAITVTGCGTSDSPKADPAQLLGAAKARVDRTSTVHFSLTSTAGSDGGTTILGGNGDLVRPDSMQGGFTVSVDGFRADVKVVSKGGVFTAELPFSSRYERTDPSKFGLEDPAELMNPQTGLTSLISAASDLRIGPERRLSGELLDSVDAMIPGSKVPVLPDVSPKQPVALVALIDPADDELRQVRLTGPFTKSGSDSTYVLTLTAYDEHVEITLPSGF